MNLQKLRQICYRDEHGSVAMRITLPPNDPLNHVEFTDDQGNNHTAQARAIRYNSTSGMMVVTYSTEEDLSRLDENERTEFNIVFGETFLPRLKQILVENGFHSGFLPREVDDAFNDEPFATFYFSPFEFITPQILHACYTDGRSMRAAVEFQAYLNRHGLLPPTEID